MDFNSALSQIKLRNQNLELCSQLDIELLVLDILKIDKNDLYRDNPLLSQDQLDRLLELIDRREKGEPLAYIREKIGFWNLDLYIDQRVLVPRPETEVLVERILENFNSKKLNVLDLGTGSGFPGICLGIIDPNRELTLVDSNRKKTSFLIHIKNELGLNSVSIKNSRVEEIEQINETNIVCRAFKEPDALLKSLENKITKKNKIILMVSEKEPLFAQGFDIAYKESEASKILGKKRGFLEIQMS